MKKVLLSLLVIFFIIGVGAIVFIDQIFKKGANYALEKVSDEFNGSVSSVEVDVSEAKVNFDLELTTEDQKETFLNAKGVEVDANPLSGTFDFTLKKLDADLTQNAITSLQNYLEKAQSKIKEQAQAQTDESSSSGSLLTSLPLKPGNIHLEQITVTLPKSGFHFELPLVDLDFGKGFGLIKDILLTYRPLDMRVIDVPEIALNFGENIFEETPIKFGAKVFEPTFKMAPEIVQAVQELPKLPSSGPKKKSTEPPVQLSSLLVDGFDAYYIGSHTLHNGVEKIDINFDQGKGNINTILAELNQQDPFFNLDSIELDFKGGALQGKDNANLQVHIKDTDIEVSDSLLKALKDVSSTLKQKFKGPAQAQEEDKPQAESPKQGPSMVEQISSIVVTNSTARLESPPVSGSLDRAELNMDQGEFTVNNVTANLLTNNSRFFNLDTFLVEFEPDIVTSKERPHLNAVVNDFHLIVSKELQNALNQGKKPEDKKKKEPLSLPFTIDRILVGSGKITMKQLPGIGEQEYLELNDIFGKITDLTFQQGTQLASYGFNGTFEGASKGIANGKIDSTALPPQWSLNAKLFNFDMEKMNEELRERIPLTFQEGIFNVYAEAVSREGEIIGYMKPFLKDASYMGNEKDYKGVKHFFVELFARFSNWILENDEKNSVATRIPFRVEDGKLNTDISTASWRAIEHGLLETDRVTPGIEDKYQLKQAQEEE